MRAPVGNEVIGLTGDTHWQAAQRVLVIDPVTNAANVKKEGSVDLSLFQMVSHADRVQGRMHRYLPQSATSTVWIRSRRSTSSSKTRPKALDISSLEFYHLLCSSIYPSGAVHVSHNGCRRFKTKPSSVNKLIICRCQQPSSVAVNKHHLSLSTNCSTAAGS